MQRELLALGLLIGATFSCGVAAGAVWLRSDGDEQATVASSDAPDGGSAQLTSASGDASGDTQAPALEVRTPDGQRVVAAQVLLTGIAEPGASVFVNEAPVGVQPDGSWILTWNLAHGQNIATVRATDRAGNTTAKTITMHRDVPAAPPPQPLVQRPAEPPVQKHEATIAQKPAEPAPPAPKPVVQQPPAVKPVTFTAKQAFGTCAEDPPYDVYTGTATPGATVRIFSTYATAQTVADDSGRWELKVFFPNAPVNKTFTVTASDGWSLQNFKFTRTG